MSKVRECFPVDEGELRSPPEVDLEPFVVFTKLRADGAWIYAGWLEAPDDETALFYAREHYGRDQPCLAVMAVPRRVLAGTDGERGRDVAAHGAGAWEVFLQRDAGDIWRSAGIVEADGPDDAVARARARVERAAEAHSIWVAPRDAVLVTGPDELAFPLSDQSYRLPRGYSGEVRRKWQQFRNEDTLREYERDDLKESF